VRQGTGPGVRLAAGKRGAGATWKAPLSLVEALQTGPQYEEGQEGEGPYEADMGSPGEARSPQPMSSAKEGFMQSSVLHECCVHALRLTSFLCSAKLIWCILYAPCCMCPGAVMYTESITVAR
jgi:hypothetical protein